MTALTGCCLPSLSSSRTLQPPEFDLPRPHPRLSPPGRPLSLGHLNREYLLCKALAPLTTQHKTLPAGCPPTPTPSAPPMPLPPTPRFSTLHTPFPRTPFCQGWRVPYLQRGAAFTLPRPFTPFPSCPPPSFPLPPRLFQTPFFQGWREPYLQQYSGLLLDRAGMLPRGESRTEVRATRARGLEG